MRINSVRHRPERGYNYLVPFVLHGRTNGATPPNSGKVLKPVDTNPSLEGDGGLEESSKGYSDNATGLPSSHAYPSACEGYGSSGTKPPIFIRVQPVHEWKGGRSNDWTEVGSMSHRHGA